MGKSARGGYSGKSTKEKGGALQQKTSKTDSSGKISKNKSTRGSSSAVAKGGPRGGATSSTRGGTSTSNVISSSPARGRGTSPARGARGGASRGSRGSSRGKGDRFAPPSAPLIVPNVPPLYPPISYFKPLSMTFRHLIPRYKHIKQYLRSNYRVKMERKYPSPFFVEKYTDSYAQPLQAPEHLRHELDHDLIPPGLTQKGLPKVEKREITDAEIIRRLEMRARREQANNEIEMSDDDENSDDEPKRKRKKLEDDDDDEDNEDKGSRVDEEEDLDQELDEGNDYLLNYFDNGEGDSDDDIDDPNVY